MNLPADEPNSYEPSLVTPALETPAANLSPEIEPPIQASLVDEHPAPPNGGWKLSIIFAVMSIIIASGGWFGGEIGSIASGAAEALPFAILAVFAYLGLRWLWAKVISVVILALVICGTGLGLLFLTIVVALQSQGGGGPVGWMSVATAVKSVGAAVGIFAAVIIAASALAFPVRQFVSRYLPLDPRSFVHMIALAAIAGLTFMSFMPLLVLGEPPLLAIVDQMAAEGEHPIDGERGARGMLRDELYGLVWLIPAAIIAVGYGLVRDEFGSLARLGLVRPSWAQVGIGLGAAFGLILTALLISPAIDWVWDAMQWPKTDAESFEQLLEHFKSFEGAIVIGIVAGLGEELAVRGVLQPRMGIWLSNLFFTALHALQYNWDALLVVFFLGLMFGYLREKTNTTTSAIAHGTYDFLLVMGALLQIPGFTD